MYYFTKRYVKTNDGRIFKLDGYNPILELKNNFWIAPKNIEDIVFQNVDVITQEEANSSALFDADFIETDVVALYLKFTQAIINSGSFRFNLLSKIVSGAVDKKHKDLFAKKDIHFGEKAQIYTLIDCYCSTLSYFARLDMFFNMIDNYDEKFIQPYIQNVIPALVKVVFPKLEINNAYTQHISNSIDEFAKAQRDKDRIERVFSLVAKKKAPSNISDRERTYNCLANRYFYRICGFDEETLSRDDKAFFATNPLLYTYFAESLLNFVNTISGFDAELFKILDGKVTN